MNSLALLILRIAAGVGLATHGYPTIMGDGGIEGFAKYLESMDFPMPLICAWAAKGSELIGGACVAIGLFTRPCALLCAVTMLVAILTTHLGDEFKEWELALAYLAMMTTILITGPGRLSIESWRNRNK
jgi:putative oxidoreductase|tara:strand:+ start:70 stop:456 length:387 start_codon:yes stop_codon:yes gene_type:complete